MQHPDSAKIFKNLEAKKNAAKSQFVSQSIQVTMNNSPNLQVPSGPGKISG